MSISGIYFSPLSHNRSVSTASPHHVDSNPKLSNPKLSNPKSDLRTSTNTSHLELVEASNVVNSHKIAKINGDTGLRERNGQPVHNRCWMKTAGMYVLKICADKPEAKAFLKQAVIDLVNDNYPKLSGKERARISNSIMNGFNKACATPNNLTLNNQGYFHPEVEQSLEAVTRLIFSKNDIASRIMDDGDTASGIMNKGKAGTDFMMRFITTSLLGEHFPPFVIVTDMRTKQEVEQNAERKWRYLDSAGQLISTTHIDSKLPVIFHTEEGDGHFEVLFPKDGQFKPTNEKYLHQTLSQWIISCPQTMLLFQNLIDNKQDKSEDQTVTSSISNQLLEQFLQHQRERLSVEHSNDRLV